MPTYTITFKDGSTLEKTANTAGEAKAAAKLEAKQNTGALEKRDHRIAVASITEKPADPPAPAAPAGAAPPAATSTSS